MNLFSRDEATSAHTYTLWAILGLVFLLPVFLIVHAAVPPMMSKVAVAGVGALAVLAVFAITHIRAQKISMPRALLLGAAWLLPLSYLLATLFADDRAVSLYGERLTMDSFVFIVTGVVLLTVAASVVRTQKAALAVYLTMLGTAVLVSVVQVVLFFARDTIAATGIVLSSLSLLGSLNDLAVFYGLVIVFVLLSLLMLPVTVVVRGVLGFIVAVSLYFLMVVNLTVLWWIIGIFALGCLIYSASARYGGGGHPNVRVSYAALGIVAVCALYILAPQSITEQLARSAQVGEVEVRPSWHTTVEVGRAALASNALFGVGPDRFSVAWSANIPPEIYASEFWQSSFSYGIGYVPTTIVTAGLFACLAWLLFFAALVYHGVRGIVLAKKQKGADIALYVRVTSFVAASYLWVLTVLQVPSPALVMFAFLFSGLFIASLTYGASPVRTLHLAFRETPSIGFLATLSLTVAVLLSLGGMYGFTSRVSAEIAYQKALRVINSEGDLAAGEEHLRRALSSRPVDVYYRLMSNIDVARLQQLIAQAETPEAIRDQVQDLLARTISNATAATEADPEDYQNWYNLGLLYANITPLGISGSAESAQAALERALELRPDAPTALLALARLSRSVGDSSEAYAYARRVVEVRPRYSEANLLLAQIQLEQEDVAGALRSVEAVTIFEPNNPVAFFQLGLLHYGTDQYDAAVAALERAIEIAPEYANARYFLGLAYWRLNMNPAAIQQFEMVAETNPDNTNVQTILSNLRAGRPPFETESALDDVQGFSPIGEDGAVDEPGDDASSLEMESVGTPAPVGQ